MLIWHLAWHCTGWHVWRPLQCTCLCSLLGHAAGACTVRLVSAWAVLLAPAVGAIASMAVLVISAPSPAVHVAEMWP